MRTFSRHWYRVLMLVALFATFWPAGATAAPLGDEKDPPIVESAKTADQVCKGADCEPADVPAPDRVQPQTYADLLDYAEKKGAVRVIVGVQTAQTFRPEGALTGAQATQQRQDIQMAQQTVLDALSGTKLTVNARYQFIPFLSLTVDKAALEALHTSELVTGIYPDKLSVLTLASSVPHIGGDEVHTQGVTGAGWAVAVLDSGVQWDHEFLGGAANTRVVAEACYSTDNAGAQSTAICAPAPHPADTDIALCYDGATNICAHGTHVAGIAAGNHTYASVGYDGVAPGADVIAVQVFSRFPALVCGTSDDCVMSWDTDQLLGLQYVYSLRTTHQIAAVNMSLGGGGYTAAQQATCDSDNAALKTAIDTLRSVGIATVIASGNDGYTDRISAPGCISTAVAVGATTDADGVASFSNSNSMLELLAPGVSIDSSVPPDNSLIYDNYNGTSMATPHVAGAWALLKQVAPGATVDEVLTALQDTGVPVTDARNSITRPRIQVDEAVAVNTRNRGILNGHVTGGGAPIENALVVASCPTQTFSLATDVTGFYSVTLEQNTYTVTASAYGYTPMSVTALGIISGSTTTQDFALTPTVRYILTGTVTDASTGWALYASVEIAPDGYPPFTVWTNPWTGVYSVTLAGNYTHTLTVAPWEGIPGYVEQSRQVNLSANRYNENFELEADAAACSAPGYTRSSTTLLSESFDSTTFPPVNWLRYEADGNTTYQWVRSTTTPHSGAGTAYHSFGGSSATEDGYLRTPQLALGSVPVLDFWERTAYPTDYVEHSVWVCTTSCDMPPTNYTKLADTGQLPDTSWRNNTSVNLSAYANQSVYLAFRYYGLYADGWYVDDVSVENVTCTAPTGGLIAGSVYDRNTNAALTGATVSNQDGYARVTAATPGSPLLSDSFYVLYSPAGSKTFTATLSGYTPAVANGMSVVAGKTGGQDFFLDAGHIIADPASLSAWLKPGGNTVKPFTLTNDGAVAATFDILEIGNTSTDVVADGGFESGTPSTGWNEASTNFGTPICDVATCGSGGGTGPHTGTYWAWFGGADSTEIGSVDQDVVIPAGAATLSFWLEIPATTSPMTMSVYMDGDELFSVSQTDAADYMPYAQVVIDVSAYADGGTHNLKFHSVEQGQASSVSNMFVDDATLIVFSPIPWLSEAPTTGSLAASGGAQTVQATFDATGLTAGTYTGTLRVESNTPYSPQDMPVRLTVGAEFISQQTGNWSGSGDNPWASGTPSANDWVTVTTGHTVTVDSVVAACYGLTIMPGGALVIPAGNTLTVEGEVRNNGTLRQTKSIPGTGAVDFHLRAGGGTVSYYGLLFEASGYTMGTTTVDIHGAVIDGTGTLNQTVGRWFDITPQTAPNDIPTTFYYADGELNGNVADTLDVYHYRGSGQWDVMSTLARGGSGAARSITAEIGPDFSPFVLKSPNAPTAVRTNGISAVSSGVLAFGVGLLALGGTAAVFRRRRRH